MISSISIDPATLVVAGVIVLGAYYFFTDSTDTQVQASQTKAPALLAAAIAPQVEATTPAETLKKRVITRQDPPSPATQNKNESSTWSVSQIFGTIIGGVTWLFSALICCFNSTSKEPKKQPKDAKPTPTSKKPQKASSAEPTKPYLRTNLADVWKETAEILKNKQYVNRQEQTVSIDLLTAIRGTACFSAITNLVDPLALETFLGVHQTVPTIRNDDAIVIAAEKSKTKKTALLNPANAKYIGGGYAQGATAFEEEIFRRSTLGGVLLASPVKDQYPLRHSEILYSPNIQFFRHGKKQNYEFMDAPATLGVITSAAVNTQDRSSPTDEDLQREMYRRIYQQLKVAKIQGIHSLVLCPFGCGAFKNDPEMVAEIYRVVINRHFQGVFEEITFAIPGNTQGNTYQAFAKQFSSE